MAYNVTIDFPVHGEDAYAEVDGKHVSVESAIELLNGWYEGPKISKKGSVMADTNKLKIKTPAFIDLGEAILPTEDIIQVYKTEDRTGILSQGKSFGLEIEYTWGTQFVDFGDDQPSRNLAYSNLAHLLLKDETA